MCNEFLALGSLGQKNVHFRNQMFVSHKVMKIGLEKIGSHQPF
jgi:hypothetical protein